jgi:uncharacterized protein GlcG (DUF336 family)
MPTQEYGPSISLADAKKVLEAAESEAARNEWAMVIAIADSGGHLIAMHRMNHAQLGSIAIAQAKARTAVSFKCHTKVFEKVVSEGGLGLRLLSIEGLCPLEGGIPLIEEGRIVGAIGVSGAQSIQDGQVATAGARVLNA